MAAIPSLGFIGCGKMARALAGGLVRTGLIKPTALIGSDPLEAAREQFSGETGGRATAENGEVVEVSKVVILAVKPDQVGGVLGALEPMLTQDHLLISIAAGVPLARLAEPLVNGTRVVRVMPNTPALVGASATGYAMGAGTGPEDAELVQRIFGAVGVAFPVKESLLDAVTGLSGSGPAYACLVIEALSDGGVTAGLPREVATRLAAQTLLGTARMVLETGRLPAELREMVTSPGGTTVEGLHELEIAGVRGAFISAVRAASSKSRRLARKSSGRPAKAAAPNLKT